MGKVQNMKYDVAVIGLGYIGLPTASIFALKGLNVLGVDIRQDVVATINAGRSWPRSFSRRLAVAISEQARTIHRPTRS